MLCFCSWLFPLSSSFTRRFCCCFFFQVAGRPAMSRRSLLCLQLVAACCCCLALLVRPVHGGRVSAGLVGGSGPQQLSDEPQFHVAQEAEEQRRVTTLKARPSWWSSPAAGGGVRAELRSVPGGPDPMHHHGSPSRRPEQADRSYHATP